MRPGITVRPLSSITRVALVRYDITVDVSPVASTRPSLIARDWTIVRRSFCVAILPFASMVSADPEVGDEVFAVMHPPNRPYAPMAAPALIKLLRFESCIAGPLN